MKTICDIYEILNIQSNKRYIGKSKNILIRFEQHKKLLKLNIHLNFHLQKSWNKYGEEYFQFNILEECSEIELNIKEIYWIQKLNSIKYGYNITKGGTGGNTYSNRTEFDKEKTSNKLSKHFKNRIWINKDNKNLFISQLDLKIYLNDGWIKGRACCKGDNNPAKRLEVRKKIIELNTGRRHTEEAKKKMSDSHKGRKHTEDVRRKIGEASKGRKHTEESKRKMSLNKKGDNNPAKRPEVRKKMSDSQKGKNLGVNNHFYGRHHTEESKRKMSEASKNKVFSEDTRIKLSKHSKNRVWINNQKISKMIQKEELEHYLNEGWKLGRIKWKQN